MKQFINGIQRYKHRLATVALIVGFFVDIITFRNLDLNYSLILLSAHLFIVAFTIIILSIPFDLSSTEDEKPSFFASVRSWLPVLQQYSMGNLLSAFLILYSASSSLIASWPFLALVAIAAIGNETLRLQKYRLPFQTSLFFLNLILFLALLSPVLMGSITVATFLISLLFSILIFSIFRRLLWLVTRDVFQEHKKRINGGAFVTITLIVVLYFVNIIPPIPLTLKNINFYYDVLREGTEYVVRDTERNFFDYFNLRGKTLALTSGQAAYVYTAVFAPARLDTQVVHRWEYRNPETGGWVTKNVVDFPISGGRRGGYRGYSLTENPTPGVWRVSVETLRGQVIVRSYVTIKRTNSSLPTSRFRVE